MTLMKTSPPQSQNSRERELAIQMAVRSSIVILVTLILMDVRVPHLLHSLAWGTHQLSKNHNELMYLCSPSQKKKKKSLCTYVIIK